MASLDIFHSDPFRTLELTAAVERVPYVPDGLASMGIFEDSPIRTEALMVEQRQGSLVLVPFSDRGAPGTQRTTEKRSARFFNVPRIRMEDTLYAREIAGIRAFGSETELLQVQKELSRRMVGPTGLRTNLNFTQEFHRLAAVQGLLLDSDGSVKFNWFSEFGITQPAAIPFNLAAKSANTLRPVCAQLVRTMARKAQGAFLPSTRVQALCGDDFWDQLVSHPDVTTTFLNWSAASDLRKGTAFESMTFGGIDWMNYRGTDDNLSVSVSLTNGAATFAVPTGSGIVTGMNVSGPNVPANSTVSVSGSTATLSGGNYTGVTGIYVFNFGGGIAAYGGGLISIPSNKAVFFPKGAPGIFQRALAPADSFEWVNTLGKPEYVQLIFDRDRNEWVKPEMTVYPLHICTRPEVLLSATMDAAAD